MVFNIDLRINYLYLWFIPMVLNMATSAKTVPPVVTSVVVIATIVVSSIGPHGMSTGDTSDA